MSLKDDTRPFSQSQTEFFVGNRSMESVENDMDKNVDKVTGSLNTIDTHTPNQITPEILQHALYGKRIVSTNDEDSSETPVLVLPSIPSEVRVGHSHIPGEMLGVFATTWICEGTEMGPIPGQVCSTLNPSIHNRWAWEVFNSESEGQLLHFIDASDESLPCWLQYVNCARHEQEQHLEIMQNGADLFFRVLRSIPPNQELLVWYSTTQRLYLGFPGVGLVSLTDTKSRTMDIPSTTISTLSSLRCVLCQRGFNSRSNLRSHMRTHTLERPFACRFCQRRFSQSSTLRNHVRLHTGEKPYKCLVCHSAYSQLAGLRAHQKSARHRPTGVETSTNT